MHFITKGRAAFQAFCFCEHTVESEQFAFAWGFFFFPATLMNVFFFSHKRIAHIAEEECLISTITCSFQVRRGRVGGFIPSHIQSR